MHTHIFKSVSYINIKSQFTVLSQSLVGYKNESTTTYVTLISRQKFRFQFRHTKGIKTLKFYDYYYYFIIIILLYPKNEKFTYFQPKVRVNQLTLL